MIEPDPYHLVVDLRYDVNRMPECVAWVKHGRCTEKDCELRHDIETVECQK